jgi:hypothetical protein
MLIKALFDRSGVLVRPEIREALGNGDVALYLSQLCYLTNYEAENDPKNFNGWFKRTILQLRKQTGMGSRAQTRCREVLEDRKMLETARGGEHNYLYFRVDLLKVAQFCRDAMERFEKENPDDPEPPTLPFERRPQTVGPLRLSETAAKTVMPHVSSLPTTHVSSEVPAHVSSVPTTHVSSEVPAHVSSLMHVLDSKTDKNKISDTHSDMAPVPQPAGVCVEKIPRSRHSKKLCIDFAEYLQREKRGVKIPEAYGWEIYLDGRDDERIDVFVANPPPDPDQIAAARREAEAREVAFLETVSLVLDGIHDGQIRSWADAEPIAAGFDLKKFRSVVRYQLRSDPELLRAFPFEDDAPMAAAAGAGGG